MQQQKLIFANALVIGTMRERQNDQHLWQNASHQ